jgi:NTE family protein
MEKYLNENLPQAIPDKGVGLALSGGAARSVAHIGVLEVLERDEVPIKAIAGTSSGSVIGALYAAGMQITEIKSVLLNAKWREILSISLSRQGIIASAGIYRFMEQILPVKDFSALTIPFAAIAVDLRTGEKVVLRSGSIAEAVRASCSLPVLLTPTVIDSLSLVDGGVASQIPVKCVREELGVTNVISVNVNYRGTGEGEYDNVIKIAVHLSVLWASRNAREEEKLADVAIQVDARGISLFDLSKAEELIRRGRKAAEDKLPNIRKLINSKKKVA